MPRNLRYDMQQAGFLARTADLRQLGHTRGALEAAVAEGWLTRPVRPWVATHQAERDAVIAVLHRGSLTSASALSSYGVWRGRDRSIHVLVGSHSSGTVARSAEPLARFATPKHPTSGVIRHWGSGCDGWRVALTDALATFARDAPGEDAVAAIDSGLHEKRLRADELPRLRALLPQRLRGLLDLVDGRAESGTESIARLRCGALARSVEIQVPVGRHRIDILLDGWLAVEIDSDEWHSSTRVDDLRKATWLTSQGYRVEHYDYQQVMHEWEAVETAIRGILATR